MASGYLHGRIDRKEARRQQEERGDLPLGTLGWIFFFAIAAIPVIMLFAG